MTGGGRGGYLTEKFLAIGDSIPTNALLKQEGLQLAEASFRDLDTLAGVALAQRGRVLLFYFTEQDGSKAGGLSCEWQAIAENSPPIWKIRSSPFCH